VLPGQGIHLASICSSIDDSLDPDAKKLLLLTQHSKYHFAKVSGRRVPIAYCLGELAGMIIFPRPQNLASSDIDPGPMHVTAAAFTADKILCTTARAKLLAGAKGSSSVEPA
jgi:hypothetical protein